MEYIPHEYQTYASEYIIKKPYCGLFLDMGLGKTVSTLTAIDYLIMIGEVKKVLVIAPLKVAESVWTTEVSKWEHLSHLKISKVLGSVKQREKALRQEADIYVINRENVTWIVNKYGGSYLPFDTIVIDELSSFKNHQSQRFKSLRTVRPLVNRVIGLTGTPTPNSLIDLWPQMYLLDRGERLEKNITAYRSKYFSKGASNGQVVFNYKLNKGSDEVIYEKISDICVSMKAKDYLDLPKLMFNTVDLEMDSKLKKQYIDFEKSKVLELMDQENLTVANMAGLSNKLLQFSNGAIYVDESKNYKEIHKLKIEALSEILEFATSPVLVFYNFKHDVEQIEKHLSSYNPTILDKRYTTEIIEKWNKGEIPFLLAHPASAGHGLNLQKGGNIVVWYGLNWSLELYQQANARLYRQGQEKPVTIYHLKVNSTLDEDVLEALERKEQGQDVLLNAVKARIDKYRDWS